MRHKLTDESRNFSTFSEFQNFNIVIRSSRVGYLSKPKSCDVWNQYGEISQTYYIQALLYYFVYLGQLFKIINLTISTRSYDDYEAFGTVGVRSYSSYIQPWTKNESCQRSYNFGEHIQWKFEGILGSFIHPSACHMSLLRCSQLQPPRVRVQSIFQGLLALLLLHINFSLFIHFLIISPICLASLPDITKRSKVWGAIYKHLPGVAA